ncbi:MAG: TIGR03790 family protein [Luteolibacter sp.]
MKCLAMHVGAFAAMGLLAVASPTADEVAVLYNSAIPDSAKLAEIYRRARGIPEENLIGLDMPQVPDISRVEYEEKIAAPLRAEFDRRSWWQRGRDREGLIVPRSNKIRVLVTMRGVPLRIKPTPKPVPQSGQANDKAAVNASDPNANPMLGRDDAAVDSELAMVGIEGLPLDGGLANKFYRSEKPWSDVDMPFLMLTARIDASSYGICDRMIKDALEAEKTGLWGMAYVDIANKFPQGDQWLESVVKSSNGVGMPTVIDRFNETLPRNYPMNEAAVYFGWYDWHASGALLNPRFKFRRGAVAVHLHSFSAEQLGNASKNWCAPLLARGATVTVGNVYEPYLHLTHDLGLLMQRLLDGRTWVEACWMAMPVTSWQGVVLGDPLYRPFARLAGDGEIRKEDLPFRALRAALLQWPGDEWERQRQISAAAMRMRSGAMLEALGLVMLQRGLQAEAALKFREAKALYPATDDQMRLDMHLIAMDRAAGRKDLAMRGLRDAQMRYGAIPEADALKGWINILEPPPVAKPPAKKPAEKAKPK